MSAREAVARRLHTDDHTILSQEALDFAWTHDKDRYMSLADAAITAHLAWLEENGFVVVPHPDKALLDSIKKYAEHSARLTISAKE